VTTPGVPDLTEGASVDVSLDDGDGTTFECTVLAFAGPVILARADSGLDRTTVELLAVGADGYVLVEQQERGVKALRGSASIGADGTLALRITDPFQLGQRRESTRVPVELEATLVPGGADGPPATTSTIDVGFGGVQVRRSADTPLADHYALTLSGDPLAAPIAAEVALARTLPESLGLAFTRIEPADRRRLIELVLLRASSSGVPGSS
jgi:PilZ domain